MLPHPEQGGEKGAAALLAPAPVPVPSPAGSLSRGNPRLCSAAQQDLALG